MTKKKDYFPIFMSVLIATTVFLAVLVLVKAESENHLQRKRSFVISQLSTLRANFEGAINSIFYLSHNLENSIAVNQEISQFEFETTVKGIMDRSPHIKQVFVVKDDSILHCYPKKSVKFLEHLPQHSAISQKQTKIIGPITFNNSINLVSHTPIFASKNSVSAIYLGMVKVVMKIDSLFNTNTNLDDAFDLKFALRRVIDQGQFIHFYGDPSIFSNDPIISTSKFPESTWQIAATLQNGWDIQSNDLFYLKIIGTLFSLLTGLMVYLTLKSEQHYRYSALHDTLTGLPNRLLLNDRIEQAIAKAKRNQTKVSILFLDLNNFKQINDTHGHKTGDNTLKRFSQTVRKLLRESDTLSRQGGDEFIVLLPDKSEFKGARVVANKIIDAFSQEVEIDKHMIKIGVSVGIAVYPDDGQFPDDLIKKADQDMYRQKRHTTHDKMMSSK